MRRGMMAGILALAAFATAAMAMDQASVPRQFPIPWGNSAGSNYIRNIPEASQIGSQNCAASLTDGFPPLTFTPSAQGGCPPFGQDMNGILKQLSQWSQWQGAGAHPLYDSSFSSSIGGYPSGAILANAATPGCYWVSTVDANSSNPDTGGANWSASCPGGGIGATSGGSANVQTITVTGYVAKRGQSVSFTAGFTNTGLLNVNVNGAGNVAVWRRTQLGISATVGGEVIAGQLVTITFDGTRFQCESCGQIRVGTSINFRGTSAPAGTLLEDGSAVSRAIYADLFSVIGTTYGTGDGSTTFNLPDSRGRVDVANDGSAGRVTSGGSGCAGNTLGTGCGAQNQTIAQANLPVVTLTTNLVDPGHTHLIPNINVLPAGNFGSAPYLLQGNTAGGTSSAGTFFATGTVSTNITGMSASTPLGGSGTPLTTLQPSLIATRAIQF